MVTKKKKPSEVNVDECPYCTDTDFFDKVLTPTSRDISEPYPTMLRRGRHWPPPPPQKIKKLPPNVIHDGHDSILGTNLAEVVILKTPMVKRDKYRIRTVTEEDMRPEYASFKIKIIGIVSRTQPPTPRGPFFTIGLIEDKGEVLYVSYNATRITHAGSELIIDSHWTPEHGRVVRLHGFSRTTISTSPAELEIINTALKFYQGETRGAPKINDENLSAAIKKLGDKATQESVAAELGVDSSNLRRWVSKRGLRSWEDAKEIYRQYRSLFST
jgi:hypothetical protein